MVGSESLRSFSLSLSLSVSVAAADAGSARILKGAAGALLPRRKRNGWTSRAVRSRSRSRAHAQAHPGLMPVPHPVAAVGDNINNNNSIDSLSGGGRPASDSDSSPPPAAHPTAASTRAPSSVRVLAITCGAVGGIIALAVVLALVYVRRVRRRVKNMKRRTNVLGPELAPMSPSQLSHFNLSPIESPRVKFDGNRIFPPRTTSERNNHLSPLSIPSVSSSPTCFELPGITPLSPIRTSTIILSPPPAAKRSPIRSPNPNPHYSPRSPIRSSRAAVPWPLITALSLSEHPQHDYEERNTNSDTPESTHALVSRR